MKNTINLTKIYFKQAFNTMFSRSSKSKSRLSGIGLVAFISIILLASSFYLMYNYATELKAIGQEHFVLILGLIFAAVVNLFMVVYEVQGYFYKTKDYEILSSMPINPFSIVTAKYISSYLTSIIYNTLIALPAFVVYFMFCKVTAGAIIYSIISLVLLPTFIIFLGSIIGFLINIITSKLKNKNVVTTVISLIFVIGVIALSSLSGGGLISNLFLSGELPLAIKIIFPYIWFLFEAIVSNSFLWFLWYLLISFAYVALGIIVVSLSYKKINANFLISNTKVSKKPLTFDANSPVVALIKKENKTFWGSAIWSLNTLVGPILMIVFAITFGMLIYKIPMLNGAEALGTIKVMFISFISFSSGMCVTTCVSISMEGKKIGLLKSLPISFNQIAIAKIAFTCIIQIAFIVVANIIFLCFIPFDILFLILSFIVPIVALVAFATLGLLINLRWPKVNWTNETEAVKQSISLLVSMFGDIILSLLPMGIYLSVYNKVQNIIPINLFLVILICWFLIIFGVAVILIKKYGEKLFKQID